jgi:hypothetical protein
MVTKTSMVISTKEEVIKKIVFDINIDGRIYSLVRNIIDGVIVSEIALNTDGYRIDSPLVVEMLNEIIEESK